MFPIQFTCGSRSSNVSSVQPHLAALLNIRSRNWSTICSLLLYCLTPSHLHSEVVMNLLHRCLNPIGIYTSLILGPCWFFYKRHLGVRTLSRMKRSTLCGLGPSVICSKLSLRKPLDPIIMQIVHKHREVLFHTSIHSFHLSVCLWMKRCQDPSINPHHLHTCCQKIDSNCGPQSETTVNGRPLRPTTSGRNNTAKPKASLVGWQGMKRRTFESRSATTHNASNLLHCGNITTKSIGMSSHGISGKDRS